MSDIVERLRADSSNISIATAAREAADEIERLREKVEILEAEIRVMRKLPAAIDAALACEQKAVRCPECLEGLPSMNWKDGKPYSYCPECGREDRL